MEPRSLCARARCHGCEAKGCLLGKKSLSPLECEPEETELISAKWSSHPSPCLRAAAGGTALPAGGSWGAARLGSPGLGSSTACGGFVCPLGLRGARCPAAARPLLGARLGNATILLPKKQNSRTALKLRAWQACSVGGVCWFFLSLSSYCGHLAGVCGLSSHFLREGIRMKAFCRSCLFGCKTLLIGYNTVYEFSSQMSKYWSWSGIIGLSHSVIFFLKTPFYRLSLY